MLECVKSPLFVPLGVAPVKVSLSRWYISRSMVSERIDRQAHGILKVFSVDKLRVDQPGWAMGDLVFGERDKIGVPVLCAEDRILRNASPTQVPLMARNACIHTAPAFPCSCLLATAC